MKTQEIMNHFTEEDLKNGKIVDIKFDSEGIDAIIVEKDGKTFQLFADHNYITKYSRIKYIKND